jgi:hypothetical protein
MMKQFQKARQILEKAELSALSGIEQDLFGSARKAATQQSASQQLVGQRFMRDQRLRELPSGQ